MTNAVERAIRAAIERGEFEDLPGAGEPLEGLDRPYDPNWWVKSWIEREREAGRGSEDPAAIERMARRLWAAPTAADLESALGEGGAERSRAGLDQLDRSEARRMWRSIKRAGTGDPLKRFQN